MPDRIDHAARARARLAQADRDTGEHKADIIAAAQVDATLALAETHRLGILLSVGWMTAEGSRARDRVIEHFLIDTGTDVDIHPDIAAALGIGGDPQ